VTGSPLLEVRELRAGYGPVRVLHGLDFVIGEGEVVVILGANGAGKTTTIRALCGMIPSQGDITFKGERIAGKRPEVVCKAGVAHVPQGRGTLNDLSVDENLQIGAFTRRDGEVKADMERWYQTFPRLAERRGQAAGSMSGGEQQMLAIARALMSRPTLLLLDEPSLGLAPMVTQEVFARLTDVNRELGTTILCVEQNANLALSIASRGYVLETGQIVISGTADQLRADESIRKAYLGF
jgi:branched-chain amino acid transport system ATP-binding protein